LSIETVGVMSMRSARSHAFSAFTQTPGLVSVELVYRQGIGLAAIAARIAFGMKAEGGDDPTIPIDCRDDQKGNWRFWKWS